jgi:hypothetical protein
VMVVLGNGRAEFRGRLFGHGLYLVGVVLAADPPLFPSFTQDTLCEIEPFLCFC